MEEVTVTDTQVIGGIPPGDTGAHHHVQDLLQDTEAGGAGHLYHAALVIAVEDIAEAVALFVAVHQLNHIELVSLLVQRGACPHLGAGVRHDRGLL